MTGSETSWAAWPSLRSYGGGGGGRGWRGPCAGREVVGCGANAATSVSS